MDPYRKDLSEVQNHLVDELIAGRVSRRTFMQRGAVLGMSIPLLGAFAAGCGGSDDDTSTSSTAGGTESSTAEAQAGGTMRVAIVAPTGAIDPVKLFDQGGLIMLGQTGEYLIWSSGDLELRPVLAEKWEPNEDGSVWTFTIRSGVKFHGGEELTASDVVATFERLSDPDQGSNSLSAFTGVLSKGGTKEIDPTTVEFTLDAPNGNFPYLVSSDNYNAIILPKNYAGDFEKTFNGTGPFKLEKYTTKQGASFVRNDEYWGTKALLDKTEFTFYGEEAPQILALQGKTVDVVGQITVSNAKSLFTDPNVTIIELKSSAHRQIHMRTDKEPYTDKRIRQAVALTVDREALVQGLFEGKADLGNDHPFAPVFPSADTTVPQRTKDIEQAKQLLSDAGMPDGFTVKMNTQRAFEIPDLGVLIQNGAKEAGITIELVLQDSGTYYGDAVYGKSPWLDSVMGITDYGHRGVPNVFLGSPLKSDGTWNSAHFKNTEYDDLVAQYTAALDIDAQRAAANKIETLLLDETPIIFPYFYNFLTATAKNAAGVEPTAMGHVNLAAASIT